MFRSLTLAAAALLLVQTSAQPAAAAPPNLVLFVGGLGSTTGSTLAEFAPMATELHARGLYTVAFSYGAAGSCQPLDESAAALAAYLEDLRARNGAARVTLVGHSNGGVVSLLALAAAPDLAPYVDRVVTVDSPLTGLSSLEALVYGIKDGECAAADDLYSRANAPGWPNYVAQLETWERGLGVDVRVVVNTIDIALAPAQQQVAGEAAYMFQASDPADGWTNHYALLRPAYAAQLAAIVAGG